MKILLYDWSQKSTYINKQDIHDTLKRLGIGFDTFLFDFEKQDISELEKFFKEISTDAYDCCFSINYFPDVLRCKHIFVSFLAFISFLSLFVM